MAFLAGLFAACARFHCAQPLSLGADASATDEAWKDRGDPAASPLKAGDAASEKPLHAARGAGAEHDAPNAAATRPIALRSAIVSRSVL